MGSRCHRQKCHLIPIFDISTSKSDAFPCLVGASVQSGKFTLGLAQSTQGNPHRLESLATVCIVFLTRYTHIHSPLSSFFFVFLRQDLLAV